MELDLRGEFLIGGVWVDATGNLLTRQALSHTRGRQDQGARANPAACRPLINNTNGQFSYDNPESPYYGKFGRNSEFRLSLHTGAPALEIPGKVGDNASTPDHSSLDITGDIDIRLDATLTNWVDATDANDTVELIGKFVFAAGGRSWLLGTRENRLYFEWSADGTTTMSATSLVELPVPASGRMAVRVTLDVDNGVGGRTITFYTAPTLAGPYTQLPGSVVQAGITSIFNSPTAVKIGDPTDITFTRPVGRVHKAEIRNGIGGAIAANPDFTAQAIGVTSFVDGAGRTWTLNGGTSITNRRTRLSQELAAAPVEWHVSGQHAWVPATTAGVLRRLRRTDRALQSTLRRRIPSFAPLAYWPLEEGAAATQGASPLRGVPPLSLTRASWASIDTLPSSLPLPVISSSSGDTSFLRARVPWIPGTLTAWHVQWVYFIEQGPAARRTFMRITTGGSTISEWLIQSGTDGTTLLGRNGDGDTIVNDNIGTGLDLFGQWVKVSFAVKQTGGNIDYTIKWQDFGGDAGVFSSSAAGTVGRPVSMASPSGGFSPDLNGMALGHLSVWPSETTTAYSGAFDAWTGETAGERMRRLVAEEGVPLTVTGVAAEQTQVGPQRPDTVLTLLEQAADADGGILYEDRERAALRYRDRASLYNQQPALVLDFNEPGLAPPLTPTGDDDATENDVEVQRIDGSSGRAVLEEGPLSVQAPPAGVGPYPVSVPLNLYKDEQTEPQAYWRLHHGTYEGRRYPQVHVMVHAAPHLAEQVLAVDVGDKIVIKNPPSQVAPGDIELIVQGYEESWAGPLQWDIVFNCTPGQPWNVGVVEDSERGRMDANPGGSLLAAAVDADDTELIVHTPAAGATHLPAPWITSSGPAPTYPAEFPFDVVLGGEVARVTANRPALYDSFGRTVASGWGSPDIGSAWTVVGTAADYSVGGGVGSVAQPAVGIAHLTLTPAPSADVDLYADVATSVLASGASLFAGPLIRAVDNNNHLMARLDFNTSAAVVLTLRKRVAGVETQLGTFTPGLTHVAGTFYRVRVQAAGTSLKAKVWLATATEPRQWQIEVTDSALTTAASIGTRSFANTGSTAVSPVMRFDNIVIVTPQRMTVTRSVEGITKGHATGAEVRVHKPAVIAL